MDDISKEEQQEVNKVKDLMMMSLSHDIKNPILSSMHLANKIKEDFKNESTFNL